MGRGRGPESAGGRGLNGAEAWVLPPLPFTLSLREAKRENPNLDENQKVAQVGNLDCSISPAFRVAQTSTLYTHVCSMLYNLLKMYV